jgi:hypothetical protein
LKKKVRGGCELPKADMQKPYEPKCGQGKTKIDLFRDFFQKSPMSKLLILFQLKFPHCIFQSTGLKIKHLEKLFVKY